MKQSAAKTLGVAALGAAFAAAGAGAANAAAPLPDAPQVLHGVQAFPGQNGAGSEVTGGAGQVLDQAQPALAEGLTATQPVSEGLALSEDQAKPVAGLIGGLPVGQGLPTQGVSANGTPLG
ncbi:ATP-binding protein [Streptomyces sp. NPDC013178]|uniref:ATP-binding protein n=1 Tax=unclassified Streptomyces TaxID=2593676 RepID=UPI0033CDBC13